MPGTSETSFFEMDGQYIAMTVGASITLGQVVAQSSTVGYVDIAGDASTKPLGVAVAGYRTSRTATDNIIATGSMITICTRGVVNVTASGTVTVGELVCTDTLGKVKTLTLSATSDTPKIVGRALSTATDGNSVRVLLTIL